MILMQIVIWTYWPDMHKTHFPILLLKASSFYEYFGDAGGQLAFIAAVIPCGLSLVVTLESPMMRFAITYNIKFILKMSKGIA